MMKELELVEAKHSFQMIQANLLQYWFIGVL